MKPPAVLTPAADGAPPEPVSSPPRAFLGVFAAGLLSFLALGAVLPALPRYVKGPLGAGDVSVGIVVGAFALSAVLLRPVAGRFADVHGRRLVFVAGSALTAIAGLLYFVPAGVPGLVLARLVLGAGEGLAFTAGATWVVDLAPEHRRGQAIGLFGLSIWGALSLGPLIGEALLNLGYDAVWAFAALVPVAGLLLARRMPDPHSAPQAGDDEPRVLFPRAALRPGVALGLANIGYATMAGFVVLHVGALGVGGEGAVFPVFAAAVVAARLLGGRLPDRLGARPCAITAAAAEAAGLTLIAVAGSLPLILVGAVLMGTGFSLLYPALALLVVAHVEERRRGAALGVFTAFFDVGVGIGAPLAGAVATLAGYPAAFAVAGALSLVGVAVAALQGRPAARPLASAA